MSRSNIYELFKSLEKDSILLSFKGLVTADLLTSIFQIMDTKLCHIEQNSRIRKKVFNILVECLQNLYHHIDLKEEELGQSADVMEAKSAVFMIARVGNSFYIRTGNYIENKDVEVLTHRLEKINSLEREELRQYYQETLNSGDVSNKGTAGLGMIDIARKSGNKLEYEFEEINQDFKFFSLNVKID